MIHTWERTAEYIKKAGTVILAISILLWAGMTFPGPTEQQITAYQQQKQQLSDAIEHSESAQQQQDLSTQLQQLEHQQSATMLKNSAAGQLGTMLEPISKLAGFDWRTNIALIGGVAAKELIVSTLGTAYSLGEVDIDNDTSLSQRIAADPQWNKVAAISAILFVLLYAPCFVTIVVMARESSWKWACFALIFNSSIAFLLATVVYQIGIRIS